MFLVQRISHHVVQLLKQIEDVNERAALAATAAEVSNADLVQLQKEMASLKAKDPTCMWEEEAVQAVLVLC